MNMLVRRTEIRNSQAVGVVFEPEGGSDHFAVMLGGSSGGIPEFPARRLAENGVTAFALGYYNASGLPPELVEIPIESLERGIELFRERFAGTRRIGVLGISKGAELALLLAAHLGSAIGPVVAVAPSHVVWFGLKPPGPGDRSSTRSSWSLGGAPIPFLPHRTSTEPVFNERGLRTDVFFDMTQYQPEEVAAARILVERSMGPILLLSGDDDHMWPAAPMAREIVQRMVEHGRGDDVTSVVYPDAGHMFLVRDFMPRLGSPGFPPFDFGGNPQADQAAGEDTWQRVVAFLKDSRVPTGKPGSSDRARSIGR